MDDDTGADVGSISGGWTLMIEASGTTAAQASINGRVTNSPGRPIGKIWVTLSGGVLAEPVMALTSSFGYYRIRRSSDRADLHCLDPVKAVPFFESGESGQPRRRPEGNGLCVRTVM